MVEYLAPQQHALAGCDLSGIDLERFFSCVADLAVQEGNARVGLLRLVLEATAEAADVVGNDYRGNDLQTFAQHFASKGAAFSKTKAGKTALAFEAWILKEGQGLGSQFLETVLVDESRFYAVFVGKIEEQDEERMRRQLSRLLTIKTLVREGDADPARGQVSELTVYEIRPSPDPSLTQPLSGGLLRPASLLPSTQEGYERAAREGVSRSALSVVFGRSPFGRARVRDERLVVEDEHGVEWCSTDGGNVWRPDVSTFRPVTGVALLAEAAHRRASTEPIAEAPRPAAAVDLVSEFGAWAATEMPVEGGPSRTVVLVDDRAWTLPYSLEDVRALVEGIWAVYPGLPEEGDRMVEAFLEEVCEDWGVEVSNPQDVRATLAESLTGWKADRDATLAARYEAAAAEEEPETTDRMEKPEFYRDDLQRLYDLQIALGKSTGEALAAVRKRFKVRDVMVTAAGEVRAPGVVDDPEGPNAPPPLPPEPPPEEEPPPPPAAGPEKGAPKGKEAPKGGKAAAGASKAEEGTQGLTAAERASIRDWVRALSPTGVAYPPLLRAWARSASVSEEALRTVWAASCRAYELELGDVRGWSRVAALCKLALPPLQESAEPTQPVPARTLDDAFLFFVTYEDDASLDEFPAWVESHCPHLAPGLDAWAPVNEPLDESRRADLQFFRSLAAGGVGIPGKRLRRDFESRRLRTSRPSLSEEQRERYAKWRRSVNMTAASLRRFLTSEVFREARKTTPGDDLRLAERGARHTMRMKATPVEEWDQTLWDWCGRQLRVINKLRLSPSPLIEQGHVTRKLVALKAWGHDPGRAGHLSEDELVAHQARDVASANRLIDSLPGTGPRYVGLLEYVAGKGPDFKTLRKNKVDLDGDERTAVMDADAVWHHGKNGEPTPAVWRSEVGGKRWYVTNTHRAFNAMPTLKGAIDRYHAFIKSTA